LAPLRSSWAKMNSPACSVPARGGMTSVLSCWIMWLRISLRTFRRLTTTEKKEICLFSER
ncbi:hypothetical protein XENORESO_010929, partial [Xenotaenia resolanae]